jgi:hypothetical protein
MGPPDKVDTVGIMLWVIVLALFAWFLEHCLRRFDDDNNTRSHGAHRAISGLQSVNQGYKVGVVLRKVKEELVCAGVLSLGATLLSEGVAVSHEARLSFEWAHLCLFLAAIVNVAVAFGTLFAADRVFAETDTTGFFNADDSSSRSASEQNGNMDDVNPAHSSRGIGNGKTRQLLRQCIDDKRAADVCVIRRAFTDVHNLPRVFNFPLYVYRSFTKCAHELHGMGRTNFLVVTALALANGLRSYLGTGAWGKAASVLSFETPKVLSDHMARLPAASYFVKSITKETPWLGSRCALCRRS